MGNVDVPTSTVQQHHKKCANQQPQMHMRQMKLVLNGSNKSSQQTEDIKKQNTSKIYK